ncbi:MAG: hypothetical protein ACYTFY_21105, partial [Planctomycetota bacterium]
MSAREVKLLKGSEVLVTDWQEDNTFTFTSHFNKGLHTFGMQADMADFDWDRLWMPMTKFENKGQLTGPWDFNLYEDNVPLIPTWKIFRNDRYVGLLYMKRPTIEDLDQKILRAEFGFYVEQDEEITFRAEPYNEFSIRPISTYVEPNMFDQFEEQEWAKKGLNANWAHYIANTLGWDKIKEKIEGGEWEEFLKAGTSIYKDKYIDPIHYAGQKKPAIPADSLTLMAFAGKIYNDQDLIDYCVDAVKYYLDLPAWGNQNKYGYGHNGDMTAALVIKHMSVLYNWIGDELGDLKDKLLARLEKQLDIFFELQLLMAQYWGGATLQDHGYRSSPSVGFAAINLLGHTDAAQKVLSFYIPRFNRTIEKQPYDGFISFAQYHKIQLHVNDMVDFRIAYKYASGIDPFKKTPAFPNVPKYILSALDEESLFTMICCTRGDRKEFHVGLPFFFMLAKDYDCERSKYLANVLMEHYRKNKFDLRQFNAPKGQDTRYVWKIYETLPIAILEYEDGIFSDKRPDVHNLNYFEDGGAIQYRNPENRFNVATICTSNTASFHAVGTDLSGTDMGISNPSMGAFTVGVNETMLLQTGESGYRTGTYLGNVLMIDGKGQYGDNGYAMGVPTRVWKGQRIQKCLMNPDKTSGSARINLAPAYRTELGVLTYTRDLYFEEDKVLVRDTVITKEKHKFNYWFNTYQKHNIEEKGSQEYIFSHENSALNFKVTGCKCDFKIEETDVVWS